MTHIDVASLNWFNKLPEADRTMIETAIKEAALFQRKDNRDKNAGRLALLKEKGMQVVENPDVASFRSKVAGLKEMDLYSNPKVQALLVKILDAVK